MVSVPLLSLINSTNTEPQKYRVFSYIIDLIKEKKGVWLAGGALRRMISGEELSSDWDFFFQDKESYSYFQDTILTDKRFKVSTIEERDKNTTVKLLLTELNIECEFQLINFNYYKYLYEVINSCDYGICMFATDGIIIDYGNKSMDDLRDKTLSINIITYPISSMRRLLKYSKQGYWIKGPEVQNLLLQCKDITVESLNEEISGS